MLTINSMAMPFKSQLFVRREFQMHIRKVCERVIVCVLASLQALILNVYLLHYAVSVRLGSIGSNANY